MLNAQVDGPPVAFRMQSSSGMELNSNTDVKLCSFMKPIVDPGIVSREVEFDIGGNIKSEGFVAPRSGIYHFDARLNFSFVLNDGASGDDSDATEADQVGLRFARWYLYLLRNNKVIETDILKNNKAPLSEYHSLALSTTLSLNKGDLVSLIYDGFADIVPRAPTVQADLISFSGFIVTDRLPIWIPRRRR